MSNSAGYVEPRDEDPMARARSLSEFQKAFSDEASCTAFLFKCRWPGGFRHVSFETVLGLAAQHEPASYWDIIKRDNPRKGRQTLEPTHAANLNTTYR